MTPATRPLISYPDPVDEVVARLVAGGVAVLGLVTILADQPWLTVPLAYGFVARVATGPTLSPLGWFAGRVVRPRLPLRPRPVPGPPKRFAQAVGAVFAGAAAMLALVLDLRTAGYAVLGVLVAFATLESVFGVCVGCRAFGLLMRVGVIPPEVCERCNDLRAGRPQAPAGSGPLTDAA